MHLVGAVDSAVATEGEEDLVTEEGEEDLVTAEAAVEAVAASVLEVEEVVRQGGVVPDEVGEEEPVVVELLVVVEEAPGVGRTSSLNPIVTPGSSSPRAKNNFSSPRTLFPVKLYTARSESRSMDLMEPRPNTASGILSEASWLRVFLVDWTRSSFHQERKFFTLVPQVVLASVMLQTSSVRKESCTPLNSRIALAVI